MRLITGSCLALTLFLGASGVEAGWFGSRRLPKPIDFPIVRQKVQEGHKAGKRSGRHPKDYVRHERPEVKSYSA
jgi:hypothetical protein